MLVAIGKFSKWIEARPIAKIKSEQAVQFFTDIDYRLGVPNSIITDNGTQFTGKKFLAFCDNYHIRMDWSAVAHPQMNGQVDRANGMILQGLKPRIFNKLNKFGRRWLTELPLVILEPENDPEQSHGLHPVLPHLRRRGHPPHGLGVRVAEAQGLPRPAEPACSRGVARPSG